MKPEHNPETKPTPRTAEELLLSGTQTQLTASEQSDMWNELKAYTEFHTAKAPAPVKSFSFRARVFSGVFAALVLVIGTGASSITSLPGDLLYPIKVGVTEPALGLTKVSNVQKLEYQGEIINNRLGELKELSKIKRLSEADILVIEQEMEERSTDIIEILSNENSQSGEARESVEILSDILADVKTHEYIGDKTFGPTRTSKIEAIEESLSEAYLEEISDFIVESPEEVTEYIDEALNGINDHITESASKDELDLEVRDYLVDVAEALQSNNVERAIYFVGEAEQVIEFNAEVDSLTEEDTATLPEPPETE